MASYLTNRGVFGILATYFRADATYEPTGYSVALVKATAPVAKTTNVWADISAHEIAAGNGYTAGGIALARNATDFDVTTEDDAGNRAFSQIKDLVWTAAGGPIPASGDGARYAILLDDDAAKNVIAVADLGSNVSVSTGQAITLQNIELRIPT